MLLFFASRRFQRTHPIQGASPARAHGRRMAPADTIPFGTPGSRFILKEASHPPATLIFHPARFGIQEEPFPFVNCRKCNRPVGLGALEVAARYHYLLSHMIALAADAEAIPRSDLQRQADHVMVYFVAQCRESVPGENPGWTRLELLKRDLAGPLAGVEEQEDEVDETIGPVQETLYPSCPNMAGGADYLRPGIIGMRAQCNVYNRVSG